MYELIYDFGTYLADEKRISQNTLESYKRDISQYILYLHNNNIKNINVANKTSIITYMLFLQKEKKSASTIARNLSSLKTFYRFLIYKNLVKNDPTFNLEAPKPKKVLPVILTISEIDNLLSQPKNSSAKGSRDKAMLELLYATGMKVTELILLKIDDIFLDLSFVKCYNGERERIVPVGKIALNAVKEYIREYRKIHVKNPDEQILFLNNSGKGLTRQGVWKIIKYYSKQANINKTITPQIIRHSFAAHMIHNGADLNSIQEILGHVDISTTQIYAHLTKKRIKDVYVNTHPRA
ncbi:MAG: site-specific tyrosine recombinase XerD [Clostridiales bacterium]|nr:site-specific tyrosine recombinase XerD [Clostridiales bacterium]